MEIMYRANALSWVQIPRSPPYDAVRDCHMIIHEAVFFCYLKMVMCLKTLFTGRFFYDKIMNHNRGKEGL